jgi:anti-anti-sigma factor
MNNPRQNSSTQFVSGIGELAKELVKGREQEILEKLRPLVESRSVRLDLSSIERIDAAGLAALVSLYRVACSAGHEFAVVHPSRRVARILAIVGLDRILVSKELGEAMPTGPRSGSRMNEIAA